MLNNYSSDCRNNNNKNTRTQKKKERKKHQHTFGNPSSKKRARDLENKY